MHVYSVTLMILPCFLKIKYCIVSDALMFLLAWILMHTKVKYCIFPNKAAVSYQWNDVLRLTSQLVCYLYKNRSAPTGLRQVELQLFNSYYSRVFLFDAIKTFFRNDKPVRFVSDQFSRTTFLYLQYSFEKRCVRQQTGLCKILHNQFSHRASFARQGAYWAREAHCLWPVTLSNARSTKSAHYYKITCVPAVDKYSFRYSTAVHEGESWFKFKSFIL